MTRTIAGLLAGLILVSACGGEAETEREGGEEMTEGPPPVEGDTVTTSSGLQYIVIEEGEGASPEPGQQARVHYTGWLTNGQKFDSSRDRGDPFVFPVGVGRVIPGWDEGVTSMRVGSEWRLIVPPELGYGERGAGNVIPPGATLIFDVELLGIEEGS